MLLLSNSVNHRAPSGPATIPLGSLSTVGTGKVVMFCAAAVAARSAIHAARPAHLKGVLTVTIGWNTRRGSRLRPPGWPHRAIQKRELSPDPGPARSLSRRGKLADVPTAAERLDQLNRRRHLVHPQSHLGLLIANRVVCAVITLR